MRQLLLIAAMCALLGGLACSGDDPATRREIYAEQVNFFHGDPPGVLLGMDQKPDPAPTPAQTKQPASDITQVSAH